MKFVDRRRELERLRRAVTDDDGGLVVLWGRRRIGKTRLLIEWVRESGGVYWVADESAAALQRRYLAEALGARFAGFGAVRYDDWTALFARVAREAKAQSFRGPLVIDELPYLLGASPELGAVLQRFVDHDAQAAGLLVVLSGSAQHMMQGLTLDPSAPLYGRARELMKLRPISAGHIQDALRLPTPADAVRSWALWGGVPRYWELAARFETYRDAADALVLDPLGPLHEEPTRLLHEETPPATTLRPLLEAIGAGAHRVSEIGARIGQAATSLARPLARLQELELVVRETPFGQPERSTKRALYKIGDPFLRFWFSVVAARRAQLAQATRQGRLRALDGRLPWLVSTAWEDLCRDAIPHLGPRLGDRPWGPARRFWSAGGPEWDIVTEAADGRAILVGEAKWTEGEPTRADVDRTVRALVAKGAPPSLGDPPVHHAVFFPRLPRGARREHAAAGVLLVDARDVLAALRSADDEA